MNFKPLKPSDYPSLNKFFKNQKYNHSIYSLASLISWNNNSSTPYWVIKDNSLIIYNKFSGEKENSHLILPIPSIKKKSSKELLNLVLMANLSSFWFIPEQYIIETGINEIEKYFTIIEQSEYEDYIYNISDLANLPGNKYSKKRNLINQFNKNYVGKKRVKIKKISHKTIDDCIMFLEKWCKQKKILNKDLVDEKRATLNALQNFETLKLNGILLYIDNIVSAFGMGASLNKKMWALHFQKAYSNIKGLYQYFDKECAKYLINDYKYMNKESDLGNPYLKKAKKSYFPIMRIKSYKLSIK